MQPGTGLRSLVAAAAVALAATLAGAGHSTSYLNNLEMTVQSRLDELGPSPKGAAKKEASLLRNAIRVLGRPTTKLSADIACFADTLAYLQRISNPVPQLPQAAATTVSWFRGTVESRDEDCTAAVDAYAAQGGKPAVLRTLRKKLAAASAAIARVQAATHLSDAVRDLRKAAAADEKAFAILDSVR